MWIIAIGCSLYGHVPISVPPVVTQPHKVVAAKCGPHKSISLNKWSADEEIPDVSHV